MTAKEAITLLQSRADLIKKDYPDIEDYAEALQLAIEALSAQGQEGDLISRQAEIDAIEKMQMPIMRSTFAEEQFVFRGMSESLNAIKELPSAQPERKKGKWIDDDGNAATDKYCATCSACGEWSEYLTAYCPNCGARMEVEHE